MADVKGVKIAVLATGGVEPVEATKPVEALRAVSAIRRAKPPRQPG